MDNLTPDTNKSLDDLLANPFSVDTNELTSTQQNEIKQFQEKQTAPRLIDRLDANYQEQAKQLASQIDVNDAQAKRKSIYIWRTNCDCFFSTRLF